MMKKISLILTALIALGGESAAEVHGQEKGAAGLDIHITGTITEEDALEIEFTDLRKKDLVVYLDSTSGDADAAMRIGRVLRKHEAMTVVAGKEDRCHGACVLIFVAGVERDGEGEIGFARPYLTSPGRTAEEVKRQSAAMLERIRLYLVEMNIAPTVYKQIAESDLTQVWKYSGDFLFKYFVPKTDPVFDELANAYYARWYGISPLENRRRRDLASKCNDAICRRAMRWGVSEETVRARLEDLSVCDLGQDGLEVLPWRVYRDQPQAKHLYDCIGEILRRK